MSTLGLAWTESNLKQYLVDAETIAPGTSMPGQALSPGPVLDAVVWGLREADTTDDRHIRY